MKFLSLITWVTQLGFSMLFPLCFFLFLAHWLQTRYGLGAWVMILLGIFGFMTSVSTTKSCIKSMLKAAKEASSAEEPPVAFNNHD